MKKINITGHMVIKNEDKFVWYAISSVLPFIDRLLITDTGSDDNTIPIIEGFKNNKIKITKYKVANPQEISSLRQKQLEDSNSDWVWIVDGDEVYPQSLLEEIKKIMEKKSESLEGIIVGRRDLLGDIYNYQDNTAGTYNLWGKNGHFALRLINKSKVPGLHIEGIYPNEGYYDKSGKELIYHGKENFYFTNYNLHHATYLQRSSKSANLSNTLNRQKFKFETGIKIDKKDIPEAFFIKRPSKIPDLTDTQNNFYKLTSRLVTPLKKIKRRIF